jgi:hypothetical protein
MISGRNIDIGLRDRLRPSANTSKQHPHHTEGFPVYTAHATLCISAERYTIAETTEKRNSNMSAQIYPPYPPTLTTSEKEYLLSNLKDWSIAHGLAVRPVESFVPKETDPAGALATTAPVTLFPSLFPRTCFEQAKAVSKAYNELYSAISVDEAWLGEICNE